MKVVIQHPSGAVYQGSDRHADKWWDRFERAGTAVEPTPPQDAESESDQEPPRVVGLDGNWSGAQERRFEHGEHSQFADMPVVIARAKPPFGFVRNEENVK